MVLRRARTDDPAVLTIMATEPKVDLERFPAIEGLRTDVPARHHVVRVDSVLPAIPEHSPERLPVKVEPRLVDIRAVPVHARHPDDDGSRIEDETEPFFALAHGILSARALDQVRRLPARVSE